MAGKRHFPRYLAIIISALAIGGCKTRGCSSERQRQSAPSGKASVRGAPEKTERSRARGTSPGPATAAPDKGGPSTGDRAGGLAAEGIVAKGELSALVADRSTVYWIEGGKRVMAHKGGKIRLLADGQRAARSLALDSLNLYWTTADGISHISRSGTSPARIVPTLLRPTCLAVDPSGLYWGNKRGFIYRSRLPGGAKELLVGDTGSPVAAIALDQRAVYWQTTSALMSVPKAGGARPVTLHSVSPDSALVLGLAVDEHHLYWINATGHWQTPSGELRRMPKTGGQQTVLTAAVSWGILTMRANPLAVDATRIYWANPDGSLLSMPKQGGGSPTQMVQGIGAALLLAQDQTSIYSAWSEGSGKITRILRTAKGAPVAGVARSPAAAQVKDSSPATKVIVQLQGFAADLALDRENVYYALNPDAPLPAVYRVPKEGNGKPVLVGMASHNHSLLVDGQQIFFAGAAPHKEGTSVRDNFDGFDVLRAPIEGGPPTTLISRQKVIAARQPGGWDWLLGGAADASYFYWVTAKSVNKVYKSGGPVTRLASTGGAFLVGDPRALYWATRQGSILTCPTSGGEPSSLVTGKGRITGLALDSGAVYWTDRTKGAVMRASRSGGPSLVLASGQKDPHGLVRYGLSLYWMARPAAGGQSGETIMTVPKSGGGDSPRSILPGEGWYPTAFAIDATGVYLGDSRGRLLRLPH